MRDAMLLGGMILVGIATWHISPVTCGLTIGSLLIALSIGSALAAVFKEQGHGSDS